MKSKIPVSIRFGAEIARVAGVKSKIPIGTWWEFEHYRDGKLIDRWEQKNVTTEEGLNKILDVVFHGGATIATWYIGLFEDDYAPNEGDTYAVPGFTESTTYDEVNRVEFEEAAASGGSISNSANKATFTINDTATIYGAFLCGGGSSASTKEDTAGGGILMASSKFALPKDVVDDDILMVACSINLANVGY